MSIRIDGTNTTANPGTTGADADTGLVYGDNEVRIVTGGTDRVKVDSSGRLLVGTTNAVAFGSRQVLAVANGTTGGVLSLYNSTTATANTRISSNPTGSEINDIGIHAASTNGSIIAYTNNDTERLRIDASGRLLLGTTTEGISDGDNLTIADSGNCGITVRSGSSNGGAIYFSDATSGSGEYAGFIEYLHNNNALRLASNGDERMRIDSSGNVFIGGTTASSADIALNANGSATFAGLTTVKSDFFGSPIGNAVGITLTGSASTSVTAFRVMPGAFPSAESINFRWNGNATFSGSVTASNVSDIRFKENITDANPQLADAVALGSQLKNFDWNDDAPLNDELRAKRFLGLVAQEAEKVCPGLTYTVPRTKQGKELTPAVLDEDGNETKAATYEELDDSYKAINHDILVMKLLGAVAELSAKVAALEAG